MDRFSVVSDQGRFVLLNGGDLYRSKIYAVKPDTVLGRREYRPSDTGSGVVVAEITLTNDVL
jgi:hypothetical protein